MQHIAAQYPMACLEEATNWPHWWIIQALQVFSVDGYVNRRIRVVFHFKLPEREGRDVRSFKVPREVGRRCIGSQTKIAFGRCDLRIKSSSSGLQLMQDLFFLLFSSLICLGGFASGGNESRRHNYSKLFICLLIVSR